MILAIDTATRWTGLALHDGSAIVAEYGWRSAYTQTVELSPAIEQICRQGDVAAAHLKAIAVAVGPGSYTGLRVGMAVAKGLALANQTSLVGVSTLDIVAASFGPLTGRLLVAAEAGRTRVCAAVYHWQGKQGWQITAEPVIESWENLLAGLDGPLTFAGEITPAAVKLIRTADKSFTVAAPAASARRAGYLAEIGWQRLRRGQTDNAATLSPIYLRDPAGN